MAWTCTTRKAKAKATTKAPKEKASGWRATPTSPAPRDAAAKRSRQATTVAFRLKPDVVTASIVSMCFSLAPMPAKSRRRFLREVLPRWKARGGATHIRRVSEEIFSETHALSRRTRVALARARADARSAAASLALTMPRALLRAPVGFGVADAMAEAALDRASRRDAERAAARVDERARRGIFVPGDDDDDDDDDEASSSRTDDAVPDAFFSSTEDVPVSLLTGAPDGCQSAVFEALELFAPNAATWIDAPVCFATETPRQGRVVRFRNCLRFGFTSCDAARFSGARRTQEPVREKRRNRASCSWRGRARRRASRDARFATPLKKMSSTRRKRQRHKYETSGSGTSRARRVRA
jgi:hypothetical protein